MTKRVWERVAGGVFSVFLKISAILPVCRFKTAARFGKIVDILMTRTRRRAFLRPFSSARSDGRAVGGVGFNDFAGFAGFAGWFCERRALKVRRFDRRRGGVWPFDFVDFADRAGWRRAFAVLFGLLILE